ncbi:hypothetical protein Tco_0149223 [Tanacetum coccineum]
MVVMRRGKSLPDMIGKVAVRARTIGEDEARGAGMLIPAREGGSGRDTYYGGASSRGSHGARGRSWRGSSDTPWVVFDQSRSLGRWVRERGPDSPGACWASVARWFWYDTSGGALGKDVGKRVENGGGGAACEGEAGGVGLWQALVGRSS